jgi:plasmid replication initiation protein
MSEYVFYYPAKVDSVVIGDGTTVAYIEAHDSGKILVSAPISVKEGDFVLIGRKALALNPVLVTKDEIIKIFEKGNEKIYKEMKEAFESAQRKQKEIMERTPTGIG